MGIDGDIHGILLAMGDTHSDLTHSDYDSGKHHGIAPQIPSKREKIGSPGIWLTPWKTQMESQQVRVSLPVCRGVMSCCISWLDSYTSAAPTDVCLDRYPCFFKPKYHGFPANDSWTTSIVKTWPKATHAGDNQKPKREVSQFSGSPRYQKPPVAPLHRPRSRRSRRSPATMDTAWHRNHTTLPALDVSWQAPWWPGHPLASSNMEGLLCQKNRGWMC